MYKKCKSQDSTKRQEHIANCFRKLLQEKSYESITITELCQKAKLPRNTFYRYFDGKTSILQFLIEKSYTELLDIIFQIHDIKPQNTLAYYTIWLSKYREYDDIWTLTNSGQRHDILLTQITNYNAKFLTNNLNVDFNTLQTKQIIFFSYGVQGILDVWRYTGYAQNEEEIASQLYELLRTPLMSIYPSETQAKAFLSTEKESSYFVNDIHKMYLTNRKEST